MCRASSWGLIRRVASLRLLARRASASRSACRLLPVLIARRPREMETDLVKAMEAPVATHKPVVAVPNCDEGKAATTSGPGAPLIL